MSNKLQELKDEYTMKASKAEDAKEEAERVKQEGNKPEYYKARALYQGINKGLSAIQLRATKLGYKKEFKNFLKEF